MKTFVHWVTNYLTSRHQSVVAGILIESVETFKYLGLLLTTDLSWSTHINSICSKAKRILGLLYRRYYNLVDVSTIKQLYLSLVRPHLDCGCVVWNPYTCKNGKSIENVQAFACKMASKRWDAGYDKLLGLLNIPSLEQRKTHLKVGICTKLFMDCVTFLVRSLLLGMH